jgi:hypothetical protein
MSRAWSRHLFLAAKSRRERPPAIKHRHYWHLIETIDGREYRCTGCPKVITEELLLAADAPFSLFEPIAKDCTTIAVPSSVARRGGYV